jgi:hypothetical protein
MKTKKIIAYKNLSRELKRLFLSLYGTDYEDSITEFKDPRDNKLHKAVTLETDDAIYLVVVDKKVAKKRQDSAEIEEEPYLRNDNNEESEGVSFYFA